MLLNTDSLGIPQFSSNALRNLIYSGNIEKCHDVLCSNEPEIDKFNQAAIDCGIDTLTKYVPVNLQPDAFDKICQSEWYMPAKYKDINHTDLLHTLKQKCGSEEQKLRVDAEFSAFLEHNMIELLKYMVYLVDFMREHDIVWGVGRGSSVSSYILYLIGIHKIDSIKYNLDWREFLR